MKKSSLLFAIGLTFCLGAKAQSQQLVDVTSQYIPNAGFEECEALPTVVTRDRLNNIDVNVVNLYPNVDSVRGNDYAATGWKLVEQKKNANGGIITYGNNVWTSKYATAGEPGPEGGVTGLKGLCFCGNNGLVYQQANEVSLPRGYYRLIVNLYARNGQTTGKGETQQVVNIKTGFMPTGGSDEDLVPAVRSSVLFHCDKWIQDVIEIELTKPVTGRFQISYGTSYYVVVDDVKLEYFDGVITTALSKVLVKAKALNAELNSTSLAAAIETAEAFIANPTSQDDVEPQVNALKNAMTAALTSTTEAVNITAAYVDNPSFETGDQFWDGYGIAQEPINELSKAYIDGFVIYDYISKSYSNILYQTLQDMPAGYYMLDAKMNENADLVMNSTYTSCKGGVEHVFLRVNSAVQHLTSAGQLKIGARARNLTYKVDDFRLFYAKDEASLLALELAAVKADATAILNSEEFASVTGTERTELSTAINGTDMAAINAAVNNLVLAKVAYPKLEKAKQNAAAYTKDLYPYALDSYFEQIQTLIGTEPETAQQASDMATQLDNLCFKFYVSNFYCEGVEKVDYSSGNIISLAGTNVGARTDAAKWTDPKTGIQQKAIYGVKTTYPSQSKDTPSAFYMTLSSSLPEGTYVMSMIMMSSTGLTLDFCKNTKSELTGRTKIGEMTGQGTAAGGKYGAGWNDYAFTFTRNKGENIIILYCLPTENYKEWYVGNFRLYLLTDLTGISTVKQSGKNENVYYDLQGRRVAQPGKGLYILNGKKVFLK